MILVFSHSDSEECPAGVSCLGYWFERLHSLLSKWIVLQNDFERLNE